MGKIGFVILHFGEQSVTDRCIQSILLMEKQERIEIVLVDNDNEPYPENKWKEYDVISNLHILKNKESHGFSHANNIGYQYAREELKTECILILNNDIQFTQKDFISRLDHSANCFQSMIIAPDIRKESNHEPQNPLDTRIRSKTETVRTIVLNRTSLLCFPLLYPLLKQLQNREDHKRIQWKINNINYYKTAHEGIVPFGACLIFMKQFVEMEPKAFFPETMFYYEEYLLALRCFRKRYKIVYDPSIRVLHETGGATKKSTGTDRNKMRFVMLNTAKSARIYLGELCR